MLMLTDETKYSELLKELGGLLAEKNMLISHAELKAEQLTNALHEAEKERDEAVKHAMSLDTQLLDALAKIDKLKGGRTECRQK